MPKKESSSAENVLTFKCQNGVELEIYPVPYWVLRDLLNKRKPPRVPEVHIEGRSRPEPNPADPDYIEAVQEYNQWRENTIVDTCLALGVHVATVPKGMSGPDDSEWADTLEMLGMEIATNGKRRHLQWLKYVALTSDDEMGDVITQVGRVQAAIEGDVAQAEDNFRGS